jgi:SEC-C motif-containing protein
MFEKCYCGSNLYYKDCCKPYIKGKKYAPTAEALMRSRYTAYVVHAIDYILDTHHVKVTAKSSKSYESIKKWSEESEWLGLKIINVSESEEGKSTVHFEAYYERDMLSHVHHEIANFEKINDRWFYVDGEIIPQTIKRVCEKVGRNDPCPCGMQKKYKHCCGR